MHRKFSLYSQKTRDSPDPQWVYALGRTRVPSFFYLLIAALPDRTDLNRLSKPATALPSRAVWSDRVDSNHLSVPVAVLPFRRSDDAPVPRRLVNLYTGFALLLRCAEQINCSSNCLASKGTHQKKETSICSSPFLTLLEYYMKTSAECGRLVIFSIIDLLSEFQHHLC